MLLQIEGWERGMICSLLQDASEAGGGVSPGRGRGGQLERVVDLRRHLGPRLLGPHQPRLDHVQQGQTNKQSRDVYVICFKLKLGCLAIRPFIDDLLSKDP